MEEQASTLIESAIAAFAGTSMTRDEVRALLRAALDVSEDMDAAEGNDDEVAA